MTTVHSTSPSQFPSDLTQAKSLLQSIQLNDNSNSTNLYQHITNVLSRIITDQQHHSNTDLINQFQTLSSQLKSQQNTDGPTQRSTVYSNCSTNELAQQLANDTLQHYKSSLSQYQHPTVDEDNEPIDIDYSELINNNLPDIRQQSVLLQRAGISIGDTNWYKLQLAINKLIQQESDKSTTFNELSYWGQVYTTGTHLTEYTILQVLPETYPEIDEDTLDPLTEPYGTGINTYLYYVTTSLDSPQWIQLPLLTSSILSIGRNIHQLLSGNLNSDVSGFPRFPYKEAMYLRCIIARISHNTHICPKSAYIYEPDNEEPNVIINDEFNGISASDLANTSNWTHYRPAIRNDGRTSVYTDNHDSDQSISNINESMIPQLRSINHDGTNHWSIRITPCLDQPSIKSIPDPTIHTVPSDDDSTPIKHIDTYSVAVARSTVWPGASTVVYNKQYYNVYHGNGLKQSGRPYRSLSPHQQQVEISSSTVVETSDVLVEPAKPVKVKHAEEEEEENIQESEEEEEEIVDNEEKNEDDEI